MGISQATIAACPGHAPTHCHEHHHHHAQPVAFPQLMKVMAKVSLVGLLALAAYTSVQLFVPGLIVGALYGIYDQCFHAQQVSRAANFSGCSQGLWEDLAELKFPAPVALLAAVVAAAVHIDHHPDAFVPLAGFTAGFWGVNVCAPAVSLCYRTFRELLV